MSRCIACDKILTDYELTRKSVETGEFIDLCSGCYKHIKDDLQVIDNEENLNIHDVVEITCNFDET